MLIAGISPQGGGSHAKHHPLSRFSCRYRILSPSGERASGRSSAAWPDAEHHDVQIFYQLNAHERGNEGRRLCFDVSLYDEYLHAGAADHELPGRTRYGVHPW